MTQKELLYIEDAIGHEQNIIKICEECKNNIKNENIIAFIDAEINSHSNNKEELLNILKEKANG